MVDRDNIPEIREGAHTPAGPEKEETRLRHVKKNERANSSTDGFWQLRDLTREMLRIISSASSRKRNENVFANVK